MIDVKASRLHFLNVLIQYKFNNSNSNPAYSAIKFKLQ